MFYSQYILAKKGPLGTIWIAAHLERKLRKTQVAETNIGLSVDSILSPEVPIALRLSGHLLLGVVRIYSKQVNYLFHDCSEALVKIKQAFHSTVVDLPPEAATAPYHSITLPETFDLDELELLPDPENSFLQADGKFVDHHVTTREQITLQDPMEDNMYLGSQFGPDERFADGDTPQIGLDFDEDIFAEKLRSPESSQASHLLHEHVPPPIPGVGDDAIHMDIDDHHEPVSPMFGFDRIEAGGQREPSTLATLLDPLDEPISKAGAADAAPNIQLKTTFTPVVLEARTPDLNQEFCPPAEPSTPALPDESSSATIRETLFPGSAGGFDKAALNDQFSASQQVLISQNFEQCGQQSTIPGQFLASTSQQPFTSGSVGQLNMALLPQQSSIEVPRQLSPEPSQESLAAAKSSAAVGSFQQVFPVEFPKQSSAAHFEGFPMPTLLNSFMGNSHSLYVGASAASKHHHSVAPPLLAFDASKSTSKQNFTSGSMEQLNMSLFLQQSSIEVPQQLSQESSQNFIVSKSSAAVNSSQQTFPVELPIQSSGKHFQGFRMPTLLENYIGNSESLSVGVSAATSFHHSVAPPVPPFDASISNQPHTWGLPNATFSSPLDSEQLHLPLKQQPVNSNLVAQQAASSLPMHGVSSSLQKSTFPFSTPVQELPLLAQMQQGFTHTDIHMSSMLQQRQFVVTASQNTPEYILNQDFSFPVKRTDLGSPPLSSMPFTSFSIVKEGMRTQDHGILVPESEVPRLAGNSQIEDSTFLKLRNDSMNGKTFVQEREEDSQRIVQMAASSSMLLTSPSGVKEVTRMQDPTVLIPECENLRSAPDSQAREPYLPGLTNSLMNGKESSQELVPCVYVDKDTYDDKRAPAIEKTPILREETPFAPLKPSPFSNKTCDTLPGDDDVLATILGSGISAFKVMPTPYRNATSKRPRGTPRVSSVNKKQKVLLDTSTMVHGDVIRLQLANTDDIRRSRKKAPCTKHEIWALDKESQGQQVYFEPAHPELPIELHELYHRVYGVNGTVLPFTNSISVTTSNQPTIEPELVMGDIRHLAESPLPAHRQEGLVHGPVSDASEADCTIHEGPPKNPPTTKEALVDGVEEKAALGIANRLPDEMAYNSSQVLTDRTPVRIMQEMHCATAEGEIVNEVVANTDEEQNKESGMVKEQKVEMFDGAESKRFDANEALAFEESVEQGMTGQVVVGKGVEQMSEAPPRCNEAESPTHCQSARIEGNSEILVDALERSNNGITHVKEVQSHAPGLEGKAGDIGDDFLEAGSENKAIQMEVEEQVISNAMVGDKPGVDNVDVKGHNINEYVYENTENLSGIPMDEEIDDQDLGFITDAKDTEFLAADDDTADDEAVEGDMDAGDDQATMFLENSGWSTRTRNVARYLRTVFEGMENSCRRPEKHGHPTLAVDRLLVGKTRKEAARMFFETLVLKSKDYLHVEQLNPFDDIHLCPRPKLLKISL